MTTNDNIDFDDVGDAIRSDRPLRPAAAYRILFAQDNLEFQPLLIGLVTVLCRSPISLCHLGFERERADAAQI